MNETLRLNNSKTRTAMNAKISVFVNCVEAIIYLLLYNLHDCTFKLNKQDCIITPDIATLSILGRFAQSYMTQNHSPTWDRKFGKLWQMI